MIHPHRWLLVLVLIVLFSSGFARAQQIAPKPDKEEIAAAREKAFKLLESVADQLNIRYLDGKHRIECVRILGLDGKVHFASEQSVSAIDMSHLSSGLYFVEFKFKDGIYGALRVSKP